MHCHIVTVDSTSPFALAWRNPSAGYHPIAAPVKSSNTGDPGLVLYGAMALMSAAGAVWVIRKKNEEQ